MNIKAKNLSHLQVGDRVIRYLSDRAVSMAMVVASKKDGIITCGPVEDSAIIKERIVAAARWAGMSDLQINEIMADTKLPTWDFLEATGAEVDEDLGWDGITKTGSWICEEPL